MTHCHLLRNPVRPLLHLKCSWLKGRVWKHCISHVPPCLVSGCASSIKHNHKWPSDPFLNVLSLSVLLYNYPWLSNMLPNKWGHLSSLCSRFASIHGVSTTVCWTTLVHICSTWSPSEKPPIFNCLTLRIQPGSSAQKISPDEPIPKDSRTCQ